ncbi:hypothetical protein C7I87_02720 [Mesorhizobium sp. SARCC-RB16n]|uniref:hypothetical protein n=1 Tax=Mesorhizobium sp. SARCC-RB16n TaxID=2116687 RepID=UPI00122F005F|nr:hypothetical protein [Mesorhizobium sp. SARCC-RB16n]KAA3452310.1 hypothetical protein C7I87_02720 [Mesorhizobium sp. SARCC-RB16n]
MHYADEIALRRVKMLVEQYVLARSRRYDFVSTELACKAIRQVVRSPIEDTELDHLLARSAVKQGLSVRFDRIGHLEAASPEFSQEKPA